MLIGTTTQRVAILGGVRTPFARSIRRLFRNRQPGTADRALRALVERFHLQGERLGDVIAGAVIKHTKDYNLTREALLSTELDPQTPGLDVQRACGTSLEAAILIANKIALGQIDAGIAAGVDDTSDPPVVYPRSYQRLLLKSYRGRTAGSDCAPGSDCGRPICAPCCRPWSSRARACRWVRAASSWSRPGRSARSSRIGSPMRVTSRPRPPGARASTTTWSAPSTTSRADNNIRADTSLEKLAKLKPVFDLSGGGSLTAGNSTPLTDGAAPACCLGKLGAGASAAGARVAARRQDLGRGFCDGKEGLLMAPAYAVSSILSDTGLSLQDFDYYEIHEAFAAVPLCLLKAWESPSTAASGSAATPRWARSI
jgi:acetyl-CoA C-acetyltransferase